MNKKEKILFLIKLADYLDRKKEPEKANFVDQLIKDEGEEPKSVDVDIPGDEYDFLQKVYKAFGDSLK